MKLNFTQMKYAVVVETFACSGLSLTSPEPIFVAAFKFQEDAQKYMELVGAPATMHIVEIAQVTP